MRSRMDLALCKTRISLPTTTERFGALGKPCALSRGSHAGREPRGAAVAAGSCSPAGPPRACPPLPAAPGAAPGAARAAGASPAAWNKRCKALAAPLGFQRDISGLARSFVIPAAHCEDESKPERFHPDVAGGQKNHQFL